MTNRTYFKLKSLSLVLVLLLPLSVTAGFAADNNSAVNLPIGPNNGRTQAPLIIPPAPAIDAKAYILIDANSAKVLGANNPDLRLPPASLTKLMTLYLAFTTLANGQIHLDDKVPVSKKAWQTSGSRMFIKPGDEVTVRDLLQGIIVDSGNDACVAMAEFIGGSEDSFTNLMNQQAVRLGMNNTHFTDSNGLPHPDHYSSARDMAILARAIVTQFPEYYKGFSQKEFTYAGITQLNRNRLLWRYPNTDGLKTGHTDEAGYCLVSSAKQGDTRFIAAVFGAPSDNARAEDSQNLLTYAARFYETKKLYNANQSLGQVRVWKGNEKEVKVGVISDLYLTIPAGRFDKITTQTLLPSKVKAPIQKGQPLGKLTILIDNQVIAEHPLVALNADPVGGLWTRTIDSISQTVHGWWNKKEQKL
ncbi:MAG: D-alanyl-D-alanine carboxypeptidase [Gammaproteobacteria bacterium]|nr:D-alanyl-D-alanine carboxypeptidase [Gammaproteobacteria bacterium]